MLLRAGLQQTLLPSIAGMAGVDYALQMLYLLTSCVSNLMCAVRQPHASTVSRPLFVSELVT